MTIIVVGRSTTHPAKPDSPVDDYRVVEVVDADHWRIEFEEPPPDQVTADVDAAAALAAMSTALAPLTGTSTSAQQRAALLALRAAISDALGE